MNVKWPKLALRWKGALGRYQYVLLVMAAGLFLLLLPTGGGDKGTSGEVNALQTNHFDLDAFEEKLERALSQVDGAGDTRVVLTLDGGSRQILAQDHDRDLEGSSVSTTVTVGRGSGTQEVVPLQTMAPSFRGALVVCPGGGDPQIKLKLMEAMSALTGLGADKISICEGNM